AALLASVHGQGGEAIFARHRRPAFPPTEARAPSPSGASSQRLRVTFLRRVTQGGRNPRAARTGPDPKQTRAHHSTLQDLDLDLESGSGFFAVRDLDLDLRASARIGSRGSARAARTS